MIPGVRLTTARKMKFAKLSANVETISDYMSIFRQLEYQELTQYFRMTNSGWPEREGEFRTVGNIGIEKDYYEKHILTQTPPAIEELNLNDEVKLLSGNHISSHMEYDLSDIKQRILEKFGLMECEVALHDQPPGGVHVWHYDSMLRYYESIWLPADPARGKLKLNKQTQWADDGTMPIRLFVSLKDWHYGQIFQFGSKLWQGWQAGDVIWFEWQNLPHATANASMFNRPIVRVTGLISLSDEKHNMLR